MIRVILAFAGLFAMFFVGFQILSSLSGKEKWELTKLLAYSILCSLLTIAAMVGLVITF